VLAWCLAAWARTHGSRIVCPRARRCLSAVTQGRGWQVGGADDVELVPSVKVRAQSEKTPRWGSRKGNCSSFRSATDCKAAAALAGAVTGGWLAR